ncbi:hypothetical protein GPK80_02385 [Coprococcus comes]|nr:hypothetical protein [Coprococcus comes]MBT9750937.1 hypothetical protein [Coprococcus comes]
MSNLTPDELARLRLKAKHGTLTPEEQRAYNDYVTEQLSAVPSPPSGAVPPKKDKPKRNIDAIDVARKIAGVAVIVVALVILGPPIARYGLGVVDGLLDVRDSVSEQTEAVQNASVEHYSRSISDLGGGPTSTLDAYVCGNRMIWVDSSSEVSTIDAGKYWVDAVDEISPMTGMVTKYYERDRDGNIVSGPYETEDDVPAPDGWIEASSAVTGIEILEKGAHGWEYRGQLSGQTLAQWLSDNGLADGSTKEQVIPLIRFDYDGYEPMTGAYSPDADGAGVAGAKPILNDSNWIETIPDSQMFATE